MEAQDKSLVDDDIVNNTNFPDTRGIIFSTPVQNYSPLPKRKVFSIESNSTITDPILSFHIKFMEFNKDGKKSRIKEYNTAFRGRIVATCDGLVLLEKDSGLILFNPVTRELQHIPAGTKSSFPGDRYGLAASSHASPRRYKLLHLFTKDKENNIGCEKMDIIGGSWRAVDVPPTQRFNLLQSPVFAMRAMHWIQHVDGHDVECVVSMPVDDDDDEFKTTPIPGGDDPVRFRTFFAMGEFLGFSSCDEGNQIQVWVLRGGEWEKQYDIDASGLGYTNPVFCIDGDDEDDDKLVLKCGDGCFCAYDRHSGELRKIETVNGWAATDFWNVFPHVNSLVSWRT